MEESKSILKQYWGYEDFRDPQELIINTILSGQDTLALLPTGGGKSLCFQVPALIFGGKTLVISPLIALMQDQVDNLIKRGVKAKALHSNLNNREIDVILDNFMFGDLKILYISPERISTEIFQARIARTKLSLIAVDEAHCISQWGYDFRPQYFNIPVLRQIHPKVPMIALTATATTQVINDILEKLELRQPKVFQKSFSRENLSITIMFTDNKRQEIIQLLSKVKGCSIIYVRNRKQTIEVAQWLSESGISCVSYHGGMDKNIREQNQQMWMTNKVRLIVATNAFGMGIDKPDVRLVVHLDVPPSIEEYYQEAGRAGRDGKESYAVTIIDQSNIQAAEAGFEDQYPELSFIEKIYDQLCRYHKVAYGSGTNENYEFHVLDFANFLSMPIKKVYHTLDLLEKEGWVLFSDAIKKPSKIMILASPQDLYFLDHQATTKEKIINHLLRKYEGLFIDPVKIDETRIAYELEIEESKLIHYLHILKSEGIISYEPRTSAPQISFLQPRPDKNNFSIDKKAYLQRKARALDRLKYMILFLQDEQVCRQRTIVSYFDEKGKDCGKCDICLGKTQNTLSSEQINMVYSHLQKCITEQPMYIKTYINLYPFNKRLRIKKAITDFEYEGHICIDDNGLMTTNL